MACQHKTSPRLRDENGNDVPCGATYKNGKSCTIKAVYPDFRCAEHTKYLTGTKLERRAQDQGGTGIRLEVWRKWEEEKGLR